MSFLSKLFGEKKKTAEIAKNRLSLLIAHERASNSASASLADWRPTRTARCLSTWGSLADGIRPG